MLFQKLSKSGCTNIISPLLYICKTFSALISP